MRNRSASRARRTQRRQQERAEARAQEQQGKRLDVPPHIAALTEKLKQERSSSR